MRIEKKDVPKPLQKYLNHEFSSGPYTGSDYNSFQASYGRWLKKLLQGYDVEIHKGHYELSAAITRKGATEDKNRYVYISISDVRFFPLRWVDDILVRQMRYAKDWTGCRNHYATMKDLKTMVDELMDKPLEASV